MAVVSRPVILNAFLFAATAVLQYMENHAFHFIGKWFYGSHERRGEVDPAHPNHLESGKRPFHTIIPAMVFKDNKLFMSFGVMGGGIQGHVQVLVNIIDLGMVLQQALDAPHFRYMSGKDVLLEDEIPATAIRQLMALGHR